MKKLIPVLILLMISFPVFGMSESELIQRLKTNVRELTNIIEQQETELKALKNEANELHDEIERLKKSYEKRISLLKNLNESLKRESELIQGRNRELEKALRRERIKFYCSLGGNIIQGAGNIYLGIKIAR